MENLVREMLIKLGENPDREGLIKTPKRVAEAYNFLTKGYTDDLDKIINDAIYKAEDNEMVIVKDIEFYSLCEHHILPFFGKCHIAYIPDKKILGLSKFARIADHFSRRLQIQERLTAQIADTIEDILSPLGVAVVIEGAHMCMMMRGVQKQNSFTTTSALRGAFKKSSKTRSEFLSLIK